MPEMFNHPTGTRDPKTLEYRRVAGAAFAPVELTKVNVHAALFEVSRAEALESLVPGLHPSMPSYAGLTTYSVGGGAIGPFEFSLLGVACRSGIRPRMFTVSCFASTDEAVELLASNWGFAARRARIATHMGYDAARTEIRLGERKIVEAITFAPEALLGGARAIRYPQSLSPVRLGDLEGLLQFDVAYVFGESFRGMLSLPTFDVDELSSGKLHPTDMIAGSYARLESATLSPGRLLFSANEPGEVTQIFENARRA